MKWIVSQKTRVKRGGRTFVLIMHRTPKRKRKEKSLFTNISDTHKYILQSAINKWKRFEKSKKVRVIYKKNLLSVAKNNQSANPMYTKYDKNDWSKKGTFATLYSLILHSYLLQWKLRKGVGTDKQFSISRSD